MTAEMLAKHARHIMNKGGVSSVGLGTDFDGIGKQNLEIADTSMLPELIRTFSKFGFNDDEIERICFRNVLDVYKEVLA